ncbi:MAG TPA: Crp/Fnr family transcriptional regulator [Anaerolineales bacterium]|nr:Crp/Fnr family transcriptional regulator [Anaerolineales bacterium]
MALRRKTPLRTGYTEVHQCSVDVRLSILGQLPFFEDLSQADLTVINQYFREIGFTANETICFAGDPAERLFVVADGRVKLMHSTQSGKDVLLDLLTQGEFFGSLSVLGEDVYPDTAVAQTQVCILVIEKDAFMQILTRFPSVPLKVIGIMAERLRAANERLERMSVGTVEERIAHGLLRLSDKFGEKKRGVGLLIQVPLTRDDLAALTGATTETASRVMSQLQKDGLIQSGRGWVAIRDLKGLQEIAGVEAP